MEQLLAVHPKIPDRRLSLRRSEPFGEAMRGGGPGIPGGLPDRVR
jgi:hypothetical protein